jgi:hypothetical protein
MQIMHSISSEIDAILREEIKQAQKDDPALIVRSSFEVIENFLQQGMSLERIAAALQKHGIRITKGHLVRHLGMLREERGMQPLKRGRKRSPASTPSSTPTTARPQSLVQPAVAVELAALATDIPPDNNTATRINQGSDQTTVSGQIAFPEEISKLKFIEVKGELLDVTKMNIDDYLTVSKSITGNAKIPDGMFETIAAENRIRGLYERALRQYDEAIAKWKSTQ